MNPSSLAYDRHYGEIYVADTGNNRVVIFDRTGNYVFEFSDRLRLASPRMIATDSLGHILALCDRTAYHIEVFDYNGTFLRDIALVSPHGDSLVTASSFAIDDSDRVYVLTGEPGHVFVYATDGTPLRDFAIFQEFKKLLNWKYLQNY